MAYSRWSCSIWYTFWAVTPKVCIPLEGPDPQEEQFCVDCELYFSYKNIKKDMMNCINNVRYHYEFKLDVDNENRPSDEDYNELEGYMQEFVLDVEKEFPEIK